MKCFSLFSGIGGFDLALTRQGHTMVGACEIDKYARRVYSEHFPDVPMWEDATKINPKEIPDFEMLCAGFPCQAFSLAGRRLGFEDTRGTLFHEIARIAKEKRPGIILLENVKGLLYHDDGRTLTTIIKTFYELGYDLEWQVINGKYFLPQNRDRIFIIGHLRGKSRSKIFPLTEINRQDERLARKKSEKRKLVQTGHCGTITATYWKGWGGSRPMLAVPVLCVNRNNRRQNGRRFKTDGEPSFTLTTQDRHGVYDGKNLRMFTPLECERLQGFPDGWTKSVSDTQRYKCVGNAVMVPVVEDIISHLTVQTIGSGDKKIE